MMNNVTWQKRIIPVAGLLAALVLLLFAFAVRPAAAASITVNTDADNTTSGDTFCTLREAINNANSDSDTTGGDCATGSGPDDITFAADYTITLGDQLPAITSEITITGNGAANTIIQANALANTATYRVFEVAAAGNLTLDGVTVRHGRRAGAGNSGGGISNGGTLMVTNSTLSGNSAGGVGGGINNRFGGTLMVTNSTLSGNWAVAGGGIYNSFGGTTTVTNSTLSGNSAEEGGGIYNGQGESTLTVTNSTLSGNSAGGGGGIVNWEGTATVTNSTLSGNSAEEGGGIINYFGLLTVTNSTLSGNSAGPAGGGGISNSGGPLSGPLTMTNSILAGNSADKGDEIHVRSGTVTADAFNVFGNNDGGKTNADAFDGFTPGANDLTATSDGTQSTALADILDTTLANNGGPTQTHALVAGSPAIDFAPSASCQAGTAVDGLDQRGLPRNVDGDGAPSANECDAGAYEYQPPIVNACPVDDPGVGQGTVGSQLTTLTGRGMGSPARQKLMGKLTVPNVADLTDLYGQLAAKEYTAVKFVRFIYPEKNAGYIQVDPETDLGEKAAISWWGADLDENELLNKPFVKGRFFLNKGMRKMKTPRAFVLYMTHQTEDTYANNWSTFTSPDNFVAGSPGFPQTNTNVLSIPETQATTDIVVQLAVTDVNRDPRTIDVIVSAGGVEVTTTLTGPTTKKSELLNLFEVTLQGVPAGVDEVEIELVSVLDEGDSAALLGAAAHYECVDVPVEPDPTFSLGDRVWYDQDQDGIQDANEPGIPQSVGLYVELDFDPDCDHQPNLSVLAGASGGDGNYLFSGLAAGDYCLDFGETFPFGWSLSPANQGGDDTKDSDVDSSGLIQNINLTADDDTRDAGVYVAGSLSGTVSCRDEGTRDNIRAIDPALPNVTVTLFEDFDGDGVADGPAIATTESDGSGYYAFTNLEVALAGDANNTTKYIVQVDVNDADLGSCNTPVGPTQYNPELDSSSPDSPSLDFTFERIPV